MSKKASADAKTRFNSSVLAPFLSPELALGFIPFDSSDEASYVESVKKEIDKLPDRQASVTLSNTKFNRLMIWQDK
jgi:hypothetical protein